MDKLKVKGIVGIALVNIVILLLQSSLVWVSDFSFLVTTTAVIGSAIVTVFCTYLIFVIQKD